MKKVLITGGTGLLGKALVKGFLHKKCKVYFTSTSKNKIKRLIQSLKVKDRRNCFPILQKFENINDIKYFVSEYRNLNFNILINNARDISNLELTVLDIPLFKDAFTPSLPILINVLVLTIVLVPVIAAVIEIVYDTEASKV